MWTRKELKQRAREALQRNYWKIVLVTFLAVILGSGRPAATSAGSSSGSAATQSTNADIELADNVEAEVYENVSETTDSAPYRILEKTVTGSRDALYAGSQEMGEVQMMAITVALIAVFVVVVLLLMACVYALTVFLYNPFYTGVCRFMLKSVDDKAEVKEVTYGFDHSYKNVVKAMFHMDIRVFAWTLLFIVPGIYKKYQYQMVPYILAEHPDMNYREALQLSRDIMNGEKWHAFVLDLSFILWHMLGMITCGIVELFFVSPYVYLTHAALYRRLCERRRDDGV